jgi:hypothetical protein
LKHDADDAIERLLRNRVETGPASGACLDAETVAAWFEGALDAAQQRAAESHASSCTRCQALLATMVQAEPPAVPPRRTVVLVRWFAPALVAAAALLVWINVARRSPDAVTTRAPQAVVVSPPSAAPAKPLEKRADPAAARETAKLAAKEISADADTRSRKTLDTRANESKPAAPRNEPASGAAAESTPLPANQQAPLKDKAERLLQRDALMSSLPSIVRSPGGSEWRIDADGGVSRSDDNGTTWQKQNLGSPARLLSGSSPSSHVVWFAGADGVVVKTTDGVSWQWRSLPERVDVMAIAATDARTATVTARDGRRFVTHDGGLTWVPAAVQENPPAPF